MSLFVGKFWKPNNAGLINAKLSIFVANSLEAVIWCFFRLLNNVGLFNAKVSIFVGIFWKQLYG